VAGLIQCRKIFLLIQGQKITKGRYIIWEGLKVKDLLWEVDGCLWVLAREGGIDSGWILTFEIKIGMMLGFCVGNACFCAAATLLGLAKSSIDIHPPWNGKKC